METQLNMKLQMNYCQKDNWAHLLKCWGAINLSYNIFHLWQSFFIFCSSHNIDTIFYLFQLCGWTIQEQHPFWRKTQSVVKFVAKNFHKTLQFQFTEVHFFWTRQQNQLSLIGYKTSVLEFDKNICDLFNWILPFAFSESNFLCFKTSLILWSHFVEGYLTSTPKVSSLSTFVMVRVKWCPKERTQFWKNKSWLNQID